MTRKLRVAIVAPSLRILGGQSVQADVLLRSWRNDPDVDAWLVPVNPVLPAPFHLLTSVKYVRTVGHVRAPEPRTCFLNCRM